MLQIQKCRTKISNSEIPSLLQRAIYKKGFRPFRNFNCSVSKTLFYFCYKLLLHRVLFILLTKSTRSRRFARLLQKSLLSYNKTLFFYSMSTLISVGTRGRINDFYVAFTNRWEDYSRHRRYLSVAVCGQTKK